MDAAVELLCGEELRRQLAVRATHALRQRDRYTPPVSRVSEAARPARGKRWPRRTWDRIARATQERRGQKIPPIEALEDAIDKRIASGESEQEATLAVIEDFERAAATVNARTTPLVPASGIIITAGGILARDGGGEAAIALIGMAFAFCGLGYLASALFTHAGRPSVGIEPTRPNVALARERLIAKKSKAHKGAILSSVGFLIVLAILI
jgi:hypothetical protein